MNEAGELAGEHDYFELKRMLKALGDVVRLNMIHVLAGTNEMTVTDLAEMLVIGGRHISQPLVSWHLTILRRVGLVRTRRLGRQVYCSLDTSRYQLCQRMLGDLIAPPARREAPSSAPVAPQETSTHILGAHQ